MITLKRIIPVVLCTAILLTFSGCGNNSHVDSDLQKILSNLVDKDNKLIERKKINAEWIKDANDVPHALVSKALDGTIFDFEAGMEFDIAAQEFFEKVIFDLYEKLYINANDIADDNDKKNSVKYLCENAQLAKGLKQLRAMCKIKSGYWSRKAATEEALVELWKVYKKSKKNIKGKTLNQWTNKYFSKLIDEYAFREYSVKVLVRYINLETGVKSEHSFTRVIRSGYKYELKNDRIIKSKIYNQATSGSLPIVVVQTPSLAEISFSLHRNTGVRELVKKGLESYEEAQPVAKAVGIKYGTLGEKGGELLDKAILEFLKKYFLSEEQIIPDDQFKFLFHSKEVPDDILDNLAPELDEEKEQRIRTEPFKKGDIVVSLYDTKVKLLSFICK